MFCVVKGFRPLQSCVHGQRRAQLAAPDTRLLYRDTLVDTPCLPLTPSVLMDSPFARKLCFVSSLATKEISVTFVWACLELGLCV